VPYRYLPTSQGFAMDLDQVPASITRNPEAIIYNDLQNPTSAETTAGSPPLEEHGQPLHPCQRWCQVLVDRFPADAVVGGEDGFEDSSRCPLDQLPDPQPAGLSSVAFTGAGQDTCFGGCQSGSRIEGRGRISSAPTAQKWLASGRVFNGNVELPAVVIRCRPIHRGPRASGPPAARSTASM
jgi:hypothetical protein